MFRNDTQKSWLSFVLGHHSTVKSLDQQTQHLNPAMIKPVHVLKSLPPKYLSCTLHLAVFEVWLSRACYLCLEVGASLCPANEAALSLSTPGGM